MVTEALFPDLIRTKLHRPPVARGVIIRPRLLEQINRGLSVPMTLVCAPAGFGKTTLVSSWLEGLANGEPETDEPVRAAWLSLDEGDNNVFVFLRYLVTAVRTAFPDALPNVLDMLRAPQQPPANTLAVGLINGLMDLPARFVLVLEDYHTISSEPIHGLLEEMSRHWPAGCHLILTSRTNPPLSLAKMRAQGQVIEIRGHDLRFTREESAAFLDEALRVPLSQSALALLQQRIEGWAVGLQLAALTLSAADNVESAALILQGTDANIADYLAGEVVGQQPPAIQEFLLKTSLFGRFCAPLCTAVLDHENDYDSRACLDWLERANLFVIPLDRTKEWYSYHALFQEMLQQRLRTRLGPEQIDALHRRAARWSAQQGLMDEALGYALAAHDYELTADLVEEALPAVLNREDRLTLERWIHLLPEAFVERRPGLLMVKAWVMEYSWQLEAQAKILETVETLLSANNSALLTSEELSILRGQLAVLEAQTAYFSNRPIAAIACCREALSSLPTSWWYVRGAANMYLGLAMHASGQSQDAVQQQLELYETISDRSSSYAVRPLMTLCFIHLLNGRLEQVIQTADYMLAQARAAGLVVNLCWAQYFLGIARYYQNDLAAARLHFEVVIAYRDVTQILTFRASCFGLALSQHAMGDATEAWQTIEMLGQSDLVSRGVEAERTSSLRARLYLLEGSIERALRWTHSAPIHVPDQPLTWLEESSITGARILLARKAEGDVEAALDVLDSAYEVAERTFNVPSQIEILVLRALALSSQSGHQLDEALAVLQRAVDLADAGAFIRLFVELGTPMRELLGQLALQGKPAGFIHRLIDAFPGSHLAMLSQRPTAYSQAGGEHVIEHLTPRELEILALMRQRLSDKEIARKLVISPKTVKRHSINIYGKLGVNRRGDAVAKAESLGLLPPA